MKYELQLRVVLPELELQTETEKEYESIDTLILSVEVIVPIKYTFR